MYREKQTGGGTLAHGEGNSAHGEGKRARQYLRSFIGLALALVPGTGALATAPSTTEVTLDSLFHDPPPGSSSTAHPTDLVATPGSGKVSLRWTAPTGLISYVYRGELINKESGRSIGWSDTGAFIDFQVANSNRYYYKVAKENQMEGATFSNEASAEPAARMIHWSGMDWAVKAPPTTFGPGPNYWSDSPNNVWVDAQDQLHLRMTSVNGKWLCSEISSVASIGYGACRFYVASPVDKLDPNIVLGLFTYQDDTHEMDVELSRWGDPHFATNAQHVVQPSSLIDPPGTVSYPRHLQRFSIPAGVTQSVHSFEWTADSAGNATVAFQSVAGNSPTPPAPSYILHRGTYSRQGFYRPLDEHARINLWLYQGKPPVSGAETEVVLSRFEYVSV